MQRVNAEIQFEPEHPHQKRHHEPEPNVGGNACGEAFWGWSRSGDVALGNAPGALLKSSSGLFSWFFLTVYI
jgi:hypothetical protein